MGCRGYCGKDYFSCACGEQDAAGFTGGGAGGNDIVQKQDALSHDLLPVLNLVYAQYIGPAFGFAGDAGLGRVVADLFQQRNCFNSQLPGYGPGDQLHLIIASLEAAQGADGDPGEYLKPLRKFLLELHSKQPSVNIGIASAVAEFEPQDAPADIFTIIP